jgi:hypothetical protein
MVDNIYFKSLLSEMMDGIISILLLNLFSLIGNSIEFLFGLLLGLLGNDIFCGLIDSDDFK